MLENRVPAINELAAEPHILAGAVTIVVVFFLMLAVTKAISWDKPGRKVRKAICLGHEVTAQRVGLYDDDNTGHAEIKMYFCTYRYQVDGKAYELDYCGKTYPPVTTSVYYLQSPSRAFLNVKSKKGPLIFFLNFCIPVLAGAAVIYLLK